MPETTPNYGLIKPDDDDFYNVDDFNKNADVIDTALSNASAHIGRKDNPHNVTAAQLDLDKVNNTSDEDKPISDATKKALDNKLSLTGGTMQGNINANGFAIEARLRHTENYFFLHSYNNLSPEPTVHGKGYVRGFVSPNNKALELRMFNSLTGELLEIPDWNVFIGGNRRLLTSVHTSKLTWIDPILTSGWKNEQYDRDKFQYTKTDNGMVYIAGLLTVDKDVTDEDVLFTLPVGFRPFKRVYTYTLPITHRGKTPELRINSSGTVTIYNYSNNRGPYEAVFFPCICFMAEE